MQSVVTEPNMALEGAGKGKKGGGIAKFFKNKKLCKWIFLAVLVVVLAVAALMLLGSGSGNVVQGAEEFTEQTVMRRNITSSLSGSGTLEAADSYTITTLVEGDILSAPFEEGDVVEKGDLLYEIDSSDALSSVEQSEISLANSQRNYSSALRNRDDLRIKTTEAGTVVTLDVEVGDSVSAGQTIGTVRNQTTMSLQLPFAADDAANIYVGAAAAVTLDGSFEVLTGTVSKVSAVDEVLSGGMLVWQVTIDVENPGGILSGQRATATIGSYACNASGTFDYKGESTLVASVSGDVARIHYQEGDFVAKDAVIVTLSSTSVEDSVASASNSVRSSQISLDNQYKQLEDYTMTAPISGTIIDKNYKEGETVESGRTLCTIFDLTYLTMTLNVDELDISSIEVGQRVTITADAVANRVYEGVVTKININGTTYSGVTSYPVTIQIDETDGLLPGMNVDAEIITESRENVLAVPNGAILRGNRVLVRTQGASSATEGEPEFDFENMELPEGLELPEGFDPENSELPGDLDISVSGGNDDAPDGFAYRNVETGVTDNSFTEILSGLAEGDVVAVFESTGTMSLDNMMMYGMGGGTVMVMEGGGGGMGGGPPGGGRMGGF